MSSDWEIKKLKEIGEVVTGKTPSGKIENAYGGEVLFLTPKDLTNEKNTFQTERTLSDEGLKDVANYLLPKNSVSVSCIGSDLGKVTILGKEAVTNQQINSIVLNEEVNHEYVYYDLSLRQNELKSIAGGSATPIINKSSFSEIEINLPPRNVQDQIVDQLAPLDQKIHLNQQTNQTLETMTQAIFKSWFVDFDPVRAKIEAKSAGRDPNRSAIAATAGISLTQDWNKIEAALDHKLTRMSEAQKEQLYRTAQLFPDELVESEIGEVPKGWEVVNYGKLIEYMIGGDWGKEEPTKKHTERVRIFRGTDLPDVFHGNDESVPVRFVQSKKLKTRKLKHGDIVFEVSGGSKNQSTGRNLLISEKLIKRFGSDLEPASFCKLMRPASIELSYYLGVYLRKAYDDDLMWQFQVQSTGISNFQTSTFMDQHCLVVPKEEILKQFQGFVEPIFDKIYNNENSELKKLRDTLLPRLISGEIQI